MMFLPLISRDAIDDGQPNPRGTRLADLSIVFACLSFAFVCARLSSRYWIHRSFGPDDYLIVAAEVLAIAMTVSYNGEAHNGFGLHKSQVSHAHLVMAMKWFFVAQLLYKVAICLTKLSYLFFYLRIFQVRSFKIAAYITGAIVCAYSTASICATIWQCNPIARTWDKSIAGTCIQIGDVWYSTSVMAIVTDVIIILLPINQIRRLQLPLGQKLALSLMFSLGVFIIACTVVRMAVVGPAVAAVDTPYYQATSNSWTFLEVNVAIICACLPDLKGPLSMVFPCLGRNKIKTQNSRQINELSGDVPISKRTMSHHTRPTQDNSSDEDFILQRMDSVQKPRDIAYGSRLSGRRSDEFHFGSSTQGS